MKTEHREHPLGTPGLSARLGVVDVSSEARTVSFASRLRGWLQRLTRRGDSGS